MNPGTTTGDLAKDPSTRSDQSLNGFGMPPEVEAAFERYRQQIKHAAGLALVCMVLYGGLVRRRYASRRSDINLLLVLKELNADLLHRLAPIIRSAWREIRLEPFLLTQNELVRAAI